MRDPMGLLAAALAAGKDEGDTPRPITEAIVDELQAVYRRYNNGCSFRPGDFVTPSTGAPLAGAGQPHIVLEVFDQPLRRESAKAGTHTEFARIDMRVACWMDGYYVAFAAESWQYERWPIPDGAPR